MFYLTVAILHGYLFSYSQGYDVGSSDYEVGKFMVIFCTLKLFLCIYINFYLAIFIQLFIFCSLSILLLYSFYSFLFRFCYLFS